MTIREQIRNLVTENVGIYQDGLKSGLESRKAKNPYIDSNKRLAWEWGNEEGKQQRDLEGYSPQYGFGLGVEYDSILNVVENHTVENLPVHTINLGRVKLACRLGKRDLIYKYLNDDYAIMSIR